ncbi:hypothetical protein SAMN05216277_10930 [Halolamina pelagica]|uniref:Uncharacterized protein n=1 Tax=Halolamina pelagica TaxID=699431 RepID=A0A1I5TDK0_9EURY|nr:hypothetical protein SAMN05216277_10930 [Halolamina pelagica]
MVVTVVKNTDFLHYRLTPSPRDFTTKLFTDTVSELKRIEWIPVVKIFLREQIHR